MPPAILLTRSAIGSVNYSFYPERLRCTACSQLPASAPQRLWLLRAVRRLRSLAYELFCCGESHSVAAACGDGNLPLKSVQLFLILAYEFVSQTATSDSPTI